MHTTYGDMDLVVALGLLEFTCAVRQHNLARSLHLGLKLWPGFLLVYHRAWILQENQNNQDSETEERARDQKAMLTRAVLMRAVCSCEPCSCQQC